MLLILAGVSIAMLTGENGILNKATTAKQKTEEATAEERVKLEVAGSFGEDGNLDKDLLNENLRKNIDSLTYNGKAITEKGVADENRINSFPAEVNVDGYNIKIEENGKVELINEENPGEETGGLEEYQTADTKPYLPENDFSHVEGTDLTTGLVVTDGRNYWTWVEVPKIAVFKTAKSETDYENIEKDLETYTTTGQFDDEGALNLDREGYTDQWYDGNGKTEEEGGNVNDTRGCGLTAQGYKDLKETMLSSVYKNGGFWIGQYEAGSDGVVRKSNSELTIPVIKEGAYPYNHITCANAQIQSSKMNSGNYTSSLMFGIQWDLVLKHLQVRGGMSQSDLTSNSSDWGNYSNVGFNITKGKYSANSGFSFNPVSETGYTKPSTTVLLTTGATERNRKMNIYDIAGNEDEWTLEKSTLTSFPCTIRSGSYLYSGSITPASTRNLNSTTNSGNDNSFRPALY